jgi:lipopolysaccharide biosynthesis glycosyltransferase
MREKMNIVLCMNSRYVMPSIVCMASVLENNINPIDFYILYSYLEEKEINLIKETINTYSKESSLILIKVQDDVFKDSPIYGRSREAYFRLLIPKLLPKNLERCLYLDGDTIVNRSLGEFYNLSFDNKAIIACEDLGEIMFFHKERHKVLNIPTEFKYFNSGVLLFNLNYFKEYFDLNNISNFIKNNNDKLKFLDQDVLNALFYDKVKIMTGVSFNYMEILINTLLTNENMEKVTIIHFLQKPWRYNYKGINAKYWWKYGKKIYKFEYVKFSILNLIYKIFLGLLLLLIPVSVLKKLKKK